MRRIAISILSLIFLAAFVLLGNRLVDLNQDKEDYKKLGEIKPVIEVESQIDIKNKPLIDPSYTVEVSEKNLSKLNSDYHSWITIKDTRIDYPVVQGTDNDFYLIHNFFREQSISGTIFIDYRYDFKKHGNQIIYGHHMKNKTMFTDLLKFKEESFFKEKEITIIENGEEKKYKAFSVYTTEEEDIHLQITFKDDLEFKQYRKILKDKSLVQNEQVFLNTQDMITLITCSYEFKDARTVVHALRVK